MRLDVTGVFQSNWEAIHAVNADGSRKYRYIINTGSSRSSKTYSLIDCYDLYARSNRDKRMTVWRDTRTDTRATVMSDFLKRLRTTERFNQKEFNITESFYRYGNGSKIEFKGADDEGVFGLTQDVAWFNEPYSISKDIFDQIDQRTSDFIFIDWNPKEDHYIDILSKHPRALVIHSTFKDNPFCPPEQRMKIESYEPTPENIANGTANQYKWDVYGLGIKGEIEGLCIPNWKPIEEIPSWAKFYGYGLDFGFTADPTALVKVYRNKNKVLIEEVIYSTGLKNRILADEMKKTVKPGDLIIADSADPKSIDELYDLGFENIHGAKKGPDSIRYGVNLMSDLDLYVKGKNLQHELGHYRNAKNKFGGYINEPEKNQQDHGIDAARYIITDMMSRGEFFVV